MNAFGNTEVIFVDQKDSNKTSSSSSGISHLKLTATIQAITEDIRRIVKTQVYPSTNVYIYDLDYYLEAGELYASLVIGKQYPGLNSYFEETEIKLSRKYKHKITNIFCVPNLSSRNQELKEEEIYLEMIEKAQKKRNKETFTEQTKISICQEKFMEIDELWHKRNREK